MKNFRIKALVVVGLCMFLMLAPAITAVYAGANPPTGGYHWQGPSVIANLTFRPVEDADLVANGGPCDDPDATIISGTVSCMSFRDYDIPIGGGDEYYGYCQGTPGEPWDQVTEEGLEGFFVGPPHTEELIEADCIPSDKTDGDLTTLQVNIVKKFRENEAGTRTAELILLFLNPK